MPGHQESWHLQKQGCQPVHNGGAVSWLHPRGVHAYNSRQMACPEGLGGWTRLTVRGVAHAQPDAPTLSPPHALLPAQRALLSTRLPLGSVAPICLHGNHVQDILFPEQVLEDGTRSCLSHCLCQVTSVDPAGGCHYVSTSTPQMTLTQSADCPPGC